MSNWKHFIAPFLLGALFPALLIGDLLTSLFVGWIPKTRVFVVASLVIVAVAFVTMRPHGMRAALASSLAFLALLTGLYFGPFVGRKAFVRAVRHVSTGMTPEEVATCMSAFEDGHPFTGGAAPLATDGPHVDWWHHSPGLVDHCTVRYGSDGTVIDVDLRLDV